METPSAQLPPYYVLEDLLAKYQILFGVYSGVLSPNAFTFQEQFSQLMMKYTITRDLDLEPLREALELYGLMLFLHRETTSDVLLADSRLRFAVCARDEVRPEINLEITAANYDVDGNWIPVGDTNERAHVIWKAFVQLFDNGTQLEQVSDHYYETRHTILKSFGVDEAFVASVNVHVTMSWRWAEELVDMMETLPEKALRQLELVVPSDPIKCEKGPRTRLLFRGLNTSMESKTTVYQEMACHAKSWVQAPVASKTLSVKVSSKFWTDHDAAAFVALINGGSLDHLEIKVESAHGLDIAMGICAQLETVRRLTLDLKMTEDWNAGGLLPHCGSQHTARRSSFERILIYVREVPSMAMFVDAIVGVLHNDSTIERCGELQLNVRVNEPRVDDLTELTRLLVKIGPRVKALTIDSYASSEFFNEETYAKDPEAFQLTPILVACPKLRRLNMQGALFDDLREVYEKGLTNLQTLQVQWAPVASTMTLAKALSDKNTQIGMKLVEFGTRLATDEVFDAFANALDNNRKLRYLRLGRRARGDELAARVNSHHQTELAPGGSAFPAMLDAMAAAGNRLATVARDCVDDDVLETIADFVGPTLHRQIHLR